MIQPQTCLRVADNSGAKNLMCIRILGSNRRYGRVGDVIIGVVKDATPNLTVKRSDVVRAVIVRTKQSVRRKDGSRLRTVAYWVAVVKPGAILFEINGLPKEMAYKVLKLASYKLPVKTKILEKV